MIDILIVDDHPIVREGLSQVILQGGKGKYRIVGKVGHFGEALRAIRDLEPDLIIVDVCLNGTDGIELVKCVRSQKDKDHIKILVLSMYDEELYAERAICAGADGYIMKHAGAAELHSALDRVAKGEIHLSGKIMTRLLQARTSKSDRHTTPIANLTDRELEVLGLLGAGLTTNQISAELHLSIKTVETYCARIKDKMGLTNFNQLMLHAVQWATFGPGMKRPHSLSRSQRT